MKPMVRSPSSVIVCTPVMLDENWAEPLTPVAIWLPVQLEAVGQLPPVVDVHVPFVWATAGVWAMARRPAARARPIAAIRESDLKLDIVFSPAKVFQFPWATHAPDDCPKTGFSRPLRA